ncbi:hypothetical protein JD969_11615 [Planctomycetota bacterium]|nr:hypothetical protein JD969_11615 [Planctomycetota bacterium]
MFIRIPLALFTSWVIYMIAMAMTVYDGLPSLILQPFVGAIFSFITVFGLFALGSPLLLPKIWSLWKKLWLPLFFIIPICWLLMVLSWFPYRITVYDHIFQMNVETFQPTLAITGYLLLLFAIIYQPKIAISKSKRWF